MKSNKYKDFYISDYQICSWYYNEHKEELNFFDMYGFLVSTINYDMKYFKDLDKYTEIEQWNCLVDLFGE